MLRGVLQDRVFDMVTKLSEQLSDKEQERKEKMSILQALNRLRERRALRACNRGN